MARNRFISTFLLWPLSKIYGAIVYVRNRMFDMGILKQEEFDIPIITVGNIAVGGTGKTPHTEYIISTLCEKYNIGVLSRGYKRHTKGFVLADSKKTPYNIGDEPYQIFKKFGDTVMVAVCENRCEGIRELAKLNPGLNLIILDDAFQHRYVKPKVSIVLTEYNRPVYNDKMMPLGRLREPMHALNRADMVVVTKCVEDMKPIDYRVFTKNLNLYPYQKLFFSRYIYGDLVPLFPRETNYIPNLDWLTKVDGLLALSGIANPRPFVKHIRKYKPTIKVKNFGDHHDFSDEDIKLIDERFKQLKGERKYIITTEKDAVRIISNPKFPQHLKSLIFYVPIRVQFIEHDSLSFEVELNKQIKAKKGL